jgi:hypothetical protein
MESQSSGMKVGRMTDDAQRYRWRSIALGLLALALLLCILREILRAGHTVPTISN